MVAEMLERAYEIINYEGATPFQKHLAQQYFQAVSSQLKGQIPYPCCLLKIPIIGNLAAEESLERISEQENLLFLQRYDGIRESFISHVAYSLKPEAIEIQSSATHPAFQGQKLEKMLAEELVKTAESNNIPKINFKENNTSLKDICKEISGRVKIT